MRKWLVCVCLAAVVATAAAKDRTFRFDFMFEATDQGAVLRQTPASGQLLLRDDHTYEMQGQALDKGRYEQSRDQASPSPRLLFYSQSGSRFFGQTVGEAIHVWISKTPTGTNVWVHGVLANAADAPAPGTAADAFRKGVEGISGNQVLPRIENGVFTQTVLYGDTSANAYVRYDPATGETAYDQTGLVLRRDGTYSLRKEFGGLVTTESGRYQAAAGVVRINFDDGSAMDLKIEQEGRKLHRYSGGMLIAEYFFLGTAK